MHPIGLGAYHTCIHVNNMEISYGCKFIIYKPHKMIIQVFKFWMNLQQHKNNNIVLEIALN